MASSQRDIFLDSPGSSQNISSSLPGTPQFVYLWCILFDWDEDVEEPFNLYQLALFPPSDIKRKWISGELDTDSRLKKLSLSAMPGKKFSLFCKVEKCR